MAKQYGFYVNLAACIGCKTCQVACKDKNNLPVGMRWRRVIQYESGEWVIQDGAYIPSNVAVTFVSTACMHCQNPICTQVCPTQAMTKRDDGIVLIDQSKCVGCRYCEWACPYGAPVFDQTKGVMTKCTMCSDLVDQGQRPVCVEACPQRVMDFGELSELQAKYGTFNNPAPLPDPNITHPSVVYGPKANTHSSDHADGVIMNLEEVAKL